jgi:hypothetical protein
MNSVKPRQLALWPEAGAVFFVGALLVLATPSRRSARWDEVKLHGNRATSAACNRLGSDS